MYRTSMARTSRGAPKADKAKNSQESVGIGKDLVAASAVPLVLGILAEGESYGYVISKRVSELSAGRLEWADGMLYPLLHRLDRLGYVEAQWRQPEDGGRRRKYYRLTAEGERALNDQHEQWTAVTDALASVWDGLNQLGINTAMAWS